MKLTKNTAVGLNVIHYDLVKFLTELKVEKPDFRMLVMEYDASDEKNVAVCYFDTALGQVINKDVLRGNRNLYTDIQAAAYFNLNPEVVIIEAYYPLAAGASDCTDKKVANEKRQGFYVIFEFKEKITQLLSDYLSRYQQLILQQFHSRNALSVEDIIEMKQDALNDAIRQIVDLDIINSLAGVQYERRESSGSIIYVKNRSDANLRVKFTVEHEFSMANLRLLRKLLEMVDGHLSLVIFKKRVIGIGTKDTDIRKVQFSGAHKWSMKLSPKETLKFSRGKFFFDRGNNQQLGDMPKGFILKKYEKSFTVLIDLLARQKHGAMLVITDHAEAEVARLSGFHRGYAITPVDLSIPENLRLIRNLASIDGAVFIDRQLNCFGAGIILDGIAKSQGSSARGARYNSARCYLDNKTDVQYAAIVFSEDETTDVVVNTVKK